MEVGRPAGAGSGRVRWGLYLPVAARNESGGDPQSSLPLARRLRVGGSLSTLSQHIGHAG